MLLSLLLMMDLCILNIKMVQKSVQMQKKLKLLLNTKIMQLLVFIIILNNNKSLLVMIMMMFVLDKIIYLKEVVMEDLSKLSFMMVLLFKVIMR